VPVQRRRRPEWKGERVQVKVLVTPEARKLLKRLARRRHQPMGEVIEALIREAS